MSIYGTTIGRHDARFYEQIGVAFKFPSLYEKLTARENLEFLHLCNGNIVTSIYFSKASG